MIPCPSQELPPFLSVMYFFLPPFSTNYSSILSHFILPSLSWSITKLLNRIYELVGQVWEKERIHEEWKETIIVPIHKRGDRDRCENYRGIALGNAADKIFFEYNIGKN
jgi:hypothetical protein